MPNHIPPRGSPARPLTVVGGGGVFERRVVLEAVLFGLPWRRLVAEIAPDHDVAIQITRPSGDVVVEDAREETISPEVRREILAETPIRGQQVVVLFDPHEPGAEPIVESLVGQLNEDGFEAGPLPVSPREAPELLRHQIIAGLAAIWVKWPDIKVAPAQLVTMQMPGDDLYVGSFRKIPVTIQPGAGFDMDDLEFVVTAGPAGGLVSMSQEADYDAVHPDVMLLAGYKPGSYELEARVKPAGTVVGRGTFGVMARWLGDDGPSFWNTGDYKLLGLPGAAWGGGSATDPENMNTDPAIGTNNVAVLLVDTSSQRFAAAEIATIRTLWENVVFNGTLVNGEILSTARYFREASYNAFDLSGQVFGPVHLPGPWSEYFKDDGNYEPKLWQECATAGDSLINYSQFQHLVCVVQGVDATTTTPARGVWAHADAIVADVSEGKIPLGTADMPATGGAAALSGMLAHELGHNIGLGDIYDWDGHPAHIRNRRLDGWALMARHGANLPHPVLVHRMKLGWMPNDRIRLFNFQAIAGSVNETVTLHPAELNNPPSGRYSGIEVRIAPSWNYYFEYRVAQSGQIGDQALPNNDRVLGTDVCFAENLEDVQRRKPVMLLPNDSDGDGPILGLNQDYEERDTSPPDGPNFPTDFSAEVTSIDGTKAEMRITYGISSQPDPSLRPWNPPYYQSPDIEVRNARNLADSKLRNVPWENHHNTVVAKVTNRGQMNAPDVVVDFWVKDLNTTNSSHEPYRVPMGSDKHDVPAGQTVQFTSATWMPKQAGHYCVEAWVRLYQTPGPNSVLEITEFNNRAQSNYDKFISATASPATRERATLKVTNPYDEPLRASVRCVKSTSPLFRTYLEHTWVNLGPRDTREIEVMFEYAGDEQAAWNPALEQYIGEPADVSIAAFVVEPGAKCSDELSHLGGFTARLVTGRMTEIIDPVFDPPVVAGRLVTVDDGSPVGAGRIIATVRLDKEERYEHGPVGPDGSFMLDVGYEVEAVEIEYLPADGYAGAVGQVALL